MTQPTAAEPWNRQQTLQRLRADPSVSVLIIGAGINGAGLFRDLALQGVDVLIVDKQDFCAGASAAPSRLIHGGLKYLETGEFRLVAQSTRERNLLLRNAPHVVHPLRTAMPTHSWWGGIWPSIQRFLRRPAKIDDRGILISELGLTLYDFFGRHFRSMPRHSVMLGGKVRESLPDIRRDVRALHTYYDAAISQAERLGFELIDDGCRAHREAMALNHVSLIGADDESVSFEDQDGSAFTVRPQVIVNAGGAWIDEINRQLGRETRHIGGTKGGHLIVDAPQIRQQLDGRMIYFGTPDGRICLIYPFMNHVLVGATDIRCTDPDQAVCDDDERDYMLEAVRYLFPEVAIGTDQVRYRYSGVRPLPRSDAADPGQISRDHAIIEDRIHRWPVLSLVGGKWTTFRGFAEEVADDVLVRLGRRREISTQQLAIGGGRDYPRDDAAREVWLCRITALCEGDRARAITLLDRYGTRGEAVARHCARMSANGTSRQRPVIALEGHSFEGQSFEGHSRPRQGYRVGEIDFVCRHERVEHLDDVLFRRLPIALSGRLEGAVIDEVATLCGEALGWSTVRCGDEIERAREIAVRTHGVSLVSRPTSAPEDTSAPEGASSSEISS